MKENTLISVIIPVYKVEKYLDKCIESVVNQTYKNLEIIVVNDGSPDECPKKCDDWAKKDQRIKVIHKQNGGLSDARNAGLDIAMGEIIMFIDSDDYIRQDSIKILFNLMIENDADVACASFIRVNENYQFLDSKIRKKKINIYEEQSKFDFWFKKNMTSTVAWGKLYKKFIFKNLRYPVGKINEDEFVVHHYIDIAKKIVYTNEQLYFYLQRPTSIMNSNFSEKRLAPLQALKEREEFFLQKKLPEKYLTFNLNALFSLLIRFKFLAKEDERLKEIVEKEIETFIVKIKSKKFNLGFKLRVKIFMYNHCLYLLKKLMNL